VKRLEVIPTGNDFLALERGELDVVSTGFAGGSFGAEEGLADAALKPLKNAKFGQVAGPPPEFLRALHFNPTKAFPYNDVRFCQAIAYSLDRNDLVKRDPARSGHRRTVRRAGAVEPLMAKAGAFLDEIGIKDVSGDGKRERPDGSAFSPGCRATTATTPTHRYSSRSTCARSGSTSR
jgi:ABC-type oligopeptide transport system substrate-binding subunit